MKESLKMLRIDPTIRAFFAATSCSRQSHDCVKNTLIAARKAKALDDEDLILDGPRPNGEEGDLGGEQEHRDEITMVEVVHMMQHPAEPLEIDKPIRCPPPEPSIIMDSQAHGQRTLSTVRSGQLRFLSESEVESLHGTSQRGTEHSADPILNW